MSDLFNFVAESNRIEGILRRPSDVELQAHKDFLACAEVAVADLERFVAAVAGRPLRRAVGQDVMVGTHLPPPGGPQIETELRSILAVAHTGESSPRQVHVEYELLHPFLDGNGRSGRALWAWQQRREGRDPFKLGFLHSFYYSVLDAAR